MTLGSFEGLLKRTSGYVYSRDGEGNYIIAEQMKGVMIRGLFGFAGSLSFTTSKE